ncbi:uncharacterized protein KD926_011446 [Aspergillus affinis]|uniref:uncharacterized protein n=1 Tax=Aspergillus affinis TaxID=1070780 RepID=UPI0022FDFAD3|nr:uncharacterized protein KD926_011446 [Aspergillus affinis]KAI9037923.1 hypothetical protein KD926_011446 [Aspergillus affinis]
MIKHDSLSEDIELLPVPKHYLSSDRLIHAGSEENSEAGTPNHDLEQKSQQNQNPGNNKGRYQGWKFSIFLDFTSSIVVLLFNVGFLLFTITRTQMGQDAALARGNCDRVHRLSTGFHWIINALSTILLAASNFGMTYQTSYGRLLLVAETNSNAESSLLYTNPVYQPDSSSAFSGAISAYPWICPTDIDCEAKGISPVHQLAENNDWNVSPQSGFETSYDNLTFEAREYQVEYCLAEPIPENCNLQYSVPLIAITVGCNLAKACILLYIWIGMKEAPILTVGDAIASFLRHQDPYSKGMCLASDDTGVYIPPIRATPHSLQYSKFRRPVSYSGKLNRWGSSISSRWGFFIFFWLVSFIICFILLLLSILGLRSSAGDILKGKLGAISSETILSIESSGNSLVASSFIANLPQLILSFLYVAYNSLLTSMCLAAEWSAYGITRKGLRVSHSPKVAQRSNYFLSIPYRYAVPLISTSAILHWLASESLFVIAVEAYDTKMRKDPSRDVFTCGYSPMAIISGVSMSVVIFTYFIVLSLRKFESAMPVAASCSLAIVAACHPQYNPNEESVEANAADAVAAIDSEREEEEMEVLLVKWGAISVSGPVGHCSSTSGEVNPLEEGGKYQ